MFAIPMVRCEQLPEVHKPVKRKQSTTTETQKSVNNVTKLVWLLKDVGCSHKIYQEAAATANSLPTQQYLPALESFRDCISRILNTLKKKIILIN